MDQNKRAFDQWCRHSVLVAALMGMRISSARRKISYSYSAASGGLVGAAPSAGGLANDGDGPAGTAGVGAASGGAGGGAPPAGGVANGVCGVAGGAGGGAAGGAPPAGQVGDAGDGDVGPTGAGGPGEGGGWWGPGWWGAPRQ